MGRYCKAAPAVGPSISRIGSRGGRLPRGLPRLLRELTRPLLSLGLTLGALLLVQHSASGADFGDIAVIEADPSIVAPGHPLPFIGRSLRFIPTQSGYSVQMDSSATPEEMGNLSSAFRMDPAEVDLPFAFPFFGEPRRKAYAYLHGIICFEKPQRAEARLKGGEFANQPPMIAALWAPALRHPPGRGADDGLYVNTQLPDRVVLTWYHVMPVRVETILNTFQVALYSNGTIRIAYLDIQNPEGLVAISAGRGGVEAAPTRLEETTSLPGPGAYESFHLPLCNPTLVTRAFYQTHPDSFNVLSVFENFAISHPSFFTSLPVKWRGVPGGAAGFDHSQAFGSLGRLDTYLDLNQLSYYPQNSASAMLTRAYGYQTVQQIISDRGVIDSSAVRVPRTLRMGFVLLVQPGRAPTQGELDRLDAIRANWMTDFANYGLGYAAMDTRLAFAGSRSGEQLSANPYASATGAPRPGSGSVGGEGQGSAGAPPGAMAPPTEVTTQIPGAGPTQLPSPSSQGGGGAPGSPANNGVPPAQASYSGPNVQGQASGAPPGARTQWLKDALAERVTRLLAKGLDVSFGELDKKLDSWTGGGSQAISGQGGAPGTPTTSPVASGGSGATAQPSASSAGIPWAAAKRVARTSHSTAPSPPRSPPAAGALAPDLNLTSADIHCEPGSPRPGESISIATSIHNMGTADARVVRARIVVIGDGRIVGWRDSVSAIPAGATWVFRWNCTLPPAQQWRIEASASTAGDANTQNNRAAVALAPVR